MARSRGYENRACADCGTIRIVRRDSDAARCTVCAGRRAATTDNRDKSAAIGALARGRATRAARRPRMPCQACGIVFPYSPSETERRFCSVECRRKDQASRRVVRACKSCSVSFNVAPGRLSGRTNSSANFCGRKCYETFLCKTGRITGRGSRWRSARAEAVARFPFCAVCGTTRRLEAHHIIPFRITKDNRQENLVPLCKKHHRVVENIFIEFENAAGSVGADDLIPWRAMIGGLKAKTAGVIRKIANEIRTQDRTLGA